MTAPPADSWIGATLAERYCIQAELGRGGMGTVFRAKHVLTLRDVALKLLHPAFVALHPTSRERFLREARCAAALRHPHIVDVLDMGMHEGIPFLVMELLQGPTLADVVRRAGRIECALALAYTLPIAQALGALHQQGVIHRDLKPGNIVLHQTEAGPQPMLLDFGLALFTNQPRLTGNETIFGTLRFMAPEQAAGVALSTATDLWSMAAVLFYALTGTTPIPSVDGELASEHVRRGRVQPVRAACPQVPEPIAFVIDRALRRDPQQRQPDVTAFSNELCEAARAAGISLPGSILGAPSLTMAQDDVALHVPTASEAARAPSHASRRPLRVAACCAGLLLLAAASWLVFPIDTPNKGAAVEQPRASVTQPVRAFERHVPTRVAEAAAQVVTDPPRSQPRVMLTDKVTGVRPARKTTHQVRSGLLPLEDEWK